MMTPSNSADTAFVCRCCGRCCRAEGVVRLRPGEAEAITRLLGLDMGDFTARYTRLAEHRQGLELIERDDHACIFLEPDNRCRIQDAKPEQCRGYPVRWQRAELDAQCVGLTVRGRK